MNKSPQSPDKDTKSEVSLHSKEDVNQISPDNSVEDWEEETKDLLAKLK